MASLPPSLRDTLAYFAKYNYPLTPTELWFWQHGSKYSKNFIERCALSTAGWKLRKQRENFSKKKWAIAEKVGESLKKFPFIEAVFVTGALAMNNCPKDDDIDLMIITSPNTLWITRFFVNLYLQRLRRHPGQTSAPDKICPNLWLDTNNLVLHTHNIYTAHEILQAKCIFDRGSVHYQFLTQNSWVKKYLPVAYTQSIKKTEYRTLNTEYLVFWPFNVLAFLIQYLYMKPKMTTEKVGLGFAFFHPTVINLDKKRK